MRTTVRLDESLLLEVRREAAKRGETLASMIEQGLRLVLAGSRSRRGRVRVKLPVSRGGGGTLAGVDLRNSSALLDIMEGRGDPSPGPAGHPLPQGERATRLIISRKRWRGRAR
jgi:hypothetical protein